MPPVLTYRYQIYGVGFNQYSSIEINKVDTICWVPLFSPQSFDTLRLSKPTRNLWYHTIQHQNWCFSKLVLSCHKHKFKHLNSRYIYLISYKIAKKANPWKTICPIENCRYAIETKMSDISQVFEVDDIFIFWMAIWIFIIVKKRSDQSIQYMV